MLKGLAPPSTEEMMRVMLPTEGGESEEVAEMVVVRVEMEVRVGVGVGAGLLVSWLLVLTLLFSLSVITDGCSLKSGKTITKPV